MMSPQDHKALSQERIKLAIETDATKKILQSVARLDLFEHYCWSNDEQYPTERWIRLGHIFQHEDMSPYPMYLQFCYRQYCKPENDVEKLLPQISATHLGSIINHFQLTGSVSDRPLGVVIPWQEELAVIHNRPAITAQPPIDHFEFATDQSLALHWFEPFIKELAEQCRCEIAEEQAIIDLEEGEWSMRDWNDYPNPVFV